MASWPCYGGSQLTLSLAQDGQGYAGTFDIALEGVPQSDPPNNLPVVTGATVDGKRLIVEGHNFDDGAIIFLDGNKQKKIDNDELTPRTRLIARKSGNKIAPGEIVTLQVRNIDNSLSNVTVHATCGVIFHR